MTIRRATWSCSPLVALALLLSSPSAAWEMSVCADPDYMPFSDLDADGFENQIAEILADELGADLTFQWWPQTPSMVSDMLRAGNCDMIMGVPDTDQGLLPTLAYYQSPYVFVYRADSGYEITNFDDPVLKDLKLGVQARNDRPHYALGRRGLANNVVIQNISRPIDEEGPFAPLIRAVAAGQIDVAVPWGAAAGYHAARQDIELTVTPTPAFELPFTPMFINVVIGVRRGDESLRDRLDIAIANRWEDIESVLEEYHVPTFPLVRPTETLEQREP